MYFIQYIIFDSISMIVLGVPKYENNQHYYWQNVMDVNAMEFIHLNVHPWFVINLYLTFNLVSIHFQLASS
jgi:hypothetical protein